MGTTTCLLDDGPAKVPELAVGPSITSIFISSERMVSYLPVPGLKKLKDMLGIGYFPLNDGTIV